MLWECVTLSYRGEILRGNESQERRPWCTSGSFTFSSNPVDSAVGGSIWEMSCHVEAGGLSPVEQKNRGVGELVWLPWTGRTGEEAG